MSSISSVSKIIVAVVFSLFIFFTPASTVSAHEYAKQGAAEATPSLTAQKNGNSYQQKTGYSSDRQAEGKQDKSFQKQGGDYQKSKDASSYQQEQSPKQESTYEQQDSVNTSQQQQ